jgi:hypothetical protein
MAEGYGYWRRAPLILKSPNAPMESTSWVVWKRLSFIIARHITYHSESIYRECCSLYKTEVGGSKADEPAGEMRRPSGTIHLLGKVHLPKPNASMVVASWAGRVTGCCHNDCQVSTSVCLRTTTVTYFGII